MSTVRGSSFADAVSCILEASLQNCYPSASNLGMLQMRRNYSTRMSAGTNQTVVQKRINQDVEILVALNTNEPS